MRLRSLLIGILPAALLSGLVGFQGAGAAGHGGLPDPWRTPGATSSAVTPESIHSTICVSGYTRTVRPPSSYTTALKRAQLASGYALRGDTSTSHYEEDHLISLELGGDPRAEANLWPEPYFGRWNARVKDRLENFLNRAVCDGRLSLRDAQHQEATDWKGAYLFYLGSP